MAHNRNALPHTVRMALATSTVAFVIPARMSARYTGVPRVSFSPPLASSPRGSLVTFAKKKGGVLFGRETNPPLPPSFDSGDENEDFGSSACSLAYASVDNDSHPSWSQLTVDVSAVPGVMRILSWLLNGLDLDLKQAEWEIEDSSSQGEDVSDVVHIRMWVVEGFGKHAGKIKDGQGVEERVMEYLRFCTDAEARQHGVIQHRGIKIDNQKKPDVTVLRVRTDDSGGQSLLSLASTITGLGLRMNMAKLDLQNELGGATTATWRMHLTDFETKKKLSNNQVQGLIYTLALVFNKSKDGGFGADYLVEKMTNEEDFVNEL